MTPKFSLYLDALRFIAAMVVLLSHFAYPRFTDGTYIWIRELNLGSDAVIIFFVLSGFLIAYTTDRKDKYWQRYFFNRATRLYSVVIPAILLTIALDICGKNLNPAAYDGWWYNDISAIKQIFFAFTFSNEWLGQGVRIGTNGPYWSLSYEAAYYIIFGLFIFIGGHKKWLLILPASLLFGTAVMALFPAWLCGAFLYKKLLSKEHSQKLYLAYAAIPVLIYALCLFINLPDTLLLFTKAVIGTDTVNETLRFSNEFIWNTLLAILVTIHLKGIYGLTLNSAQTNKKTTIARILNLCAGASFTLYLVHYPALQFFDSALPASIEKMPRDLLLLTATLITCFAFAEISERRLGWLRKKLKRA